MKKVSEWLKNKIIWNSTLRFLIQQYMTLFLSSLINILKFQLKFNFNGSIASVVTSISILGICIILTVLNFSILWRHRHDLETKYFQEKFGTLIENLKTNNLKQSLCITIQLLKWCLTIISLVLLRDYPGLQIISNIPIQLIFQIYLVSVRPYQNYNEQILMTMNEFLVSLYLYTYILLSDNTSSYDQL